jgi:hypothetical protein
MQLKKKIVSLVAFFAVLMGVVGLVSATDMIYLPFEPGTMWECVQGNNGSYSHFGTLQYAYDFTRGFGKESFGEDVLSPIYGEIVDLRTGAPDDELNDGSYPGNNNGWGNTILIKDYATNKYLRFAHLREGSIPWYLEEGESVEIGEKIGEVGNSGFSSAAHLHLHMQATSDGGAQSIQFYFIEGPLKKGSYVKSENTPNSFVLDYKHDKSLSHEVTYYKGYMSKKSWAKWDISPLTHPNQVTGKNRYFAKIKSYFKRPWYKWKFRLNRTGYFMIFVKFKGTYKRDPNVVYYLYSSQDPGVFSTIYMDQQMCSADNWHLLIGTTLKAYKYYYIKLMGQTQGKYISADGLKFVRLW